MSNQILERLGSTVGSRPLVEAFPGSTLACQVKATQEWRHDLHVLLTDARTRFADVSWRLKDSEDDTESEYSHHASIFSSAATPSQEPLIWAHKAILYARTSNIFQARYLRLKAPVVQLGSGFASTSTISLPAMHVPADPPSSSRSRPPSSLRGGAGSTRISGRTSAPPSSFRSVSRPDQSMREVQGLENRPPGHSGQTVKRTKSGISVASSTISRPISRSDRAEPQDLQLRQSGSYPSLIDNSTPEGLDSDALSVVSAASTVRKPMVLQDISPAFFEASLEYIYTAEESAKEVFDFLHDDRRSSEDTAQERLEKLRQDFVFMWRSRLYADIKIVLGEEDVGIIPDATASVLSLPLNDEADDGEQVVFYAHRMMLASRSPYFAAQLLSPYVDAQSDTVRLPSPPFTPAAMHFTLGFMYTGTLFFSNRTFDLSTAFQLWLAGSYLGIETLQTLVSSLIAEDFCHGFACSPPCKTCVRRVPRTMSFVTRADVSDFRLRQQVQDALAGTHFGHYWWKEVGNLDAEARQSIVAQVCTNLNERPEFYLIAVRQLSIVGSRMDLERSSSWVISLRAMCEAIRTQLCANISARFEAIVASQQWSSLVAEVGFSNDVFETVLTTLLDNLKEVHAAKNYETLVGGILLQEEHPPPTQILQLCEEARACIIAYIKKRWINVRLAGGFNQIKKWCLKELADELDVKSDDLLIPESDAIVAARQNELRTNGASPSWAARRSLTKRPQPGSVIDGEREAGPIHLRAAVLNRNAARVSSAQSRRTDSGRSSIGSIADASSIDHNGASPVPSPLAERRPVSQPQMLDRGRAGRSNGNQVMPLANTLAVPSAPRHQGGQGSMGSEKRVATSFLSSDPSKTVRGASSSRARHRSMESPTKAAGAAADASKSSSKARENVQPTRVSTRSRLTSTASNVSSRSMDSTRSQIRAKSAGGDQTKDKEGTLARTSGQSATQKVVSTRTQTPSDSLKDAMQADSLQTSSTSKPTLQSGPGSNAATKLAMGIPCIVAPAVREGKAARFRAIVKYIGPLHEERGTKSPQVPFIGIEVPLPLPAGIDENLYDFHDGSHRGIQYFAIGHDRTEKSTQLPHKPEQEERRLRLERMLRRDPTYATFEAQSLIHLSTLEPDVDLSKAATSDRSTKRRKDLAGQRKDSDEAVMSRGLFVKPHEVLWVVV